MLDVSGYQFEHNYGHGQEHLSMVLLMLLKWVLNSALIYGIMATSLNTRNGTALIVASY